MGHRLAAMPHRTIKAPEVRKGQAPETLKRDQFHERFMQPFQDPAFQAEKAALQRVELIAWEAYEQGRKAPVTRKAGPGHADPDYELSVDWLEARARIDAAQAAWGQAQTKSRVLLVNGSPRNDGTCPGEISKSWRLLQLAREVLDGCGIDVDVLDLSLLASDYGRHIHPCKGCVSTAMPLCHWPCSCYPNHSLNQVNDWMNDIYPKWIAAHGVMIVTPVNWYQSPSVLKLMIDRLVCADGGNPDPTTTRGKDPAMAKAIELAGWPYPKHLAGRAFSVVVHADAAGAENLRRILVDWMTDLEMIPAGPVAGIDRYVGYYEPYATSHDDLDRDAAFQEETRHAATELVAMVRQIRSGQYRRPDQGLEEPRKK